MKERLTVVGCNRREIAVCPNHARPHSRHLAADWQGADRLARRGSMSALGQKRTCALQEAVCRASAILSIALSGAVVAVMRNRLTELAD